MEKRNMAAAEAESYTRMPTATWSKWTTKKAVSDGYKVSGWVYRAVSMISKHISGIPWQVTDSDGTPIPEHSISTLLKNPNPEFSRQDFFELLVAWQQLSGLAYAKKIIDDSGNVVELWPVSPDRLCPIKGTTSHKLVDGYEIVDEKGIKRKTTDYTVDNVIAFKYMDPANPAEGIGPLQVAARAVDTDQEQVNWNKSAMQNRGILDGVFTFDRDLDPVTYGTIKQKIKELFSGSKNARDIGVIGSKATYQRLSLTPAEMDFIVSRRFNREEIFIIFGIPPQLAGVQDASTYNNYATSMRIFWELTLIPILDDLKDSLNFYFKDQLEAGQVICYDVSEVPSLKQNHREKAEISRIFHNMGVPVQALNEMFSLGVPEYEGWNLSSLLVNAGNKDDNGNSPNASSLDGNNAEGASDSGNSQSRSENLDFEAVANTAGEIRSLFSAVNKQILTAEVLSGKPVDDTSVILALADLRSGVEHIASSDGQYGSSDKALEAMEERVATIILEAIADGKNNGKSALQVRQSLEDLNVFSAENSSFIATKIHESPDSGNL